MRLLGRPVIDVVHAVRIGNYSPEVPDAATSSLRDRAAWLSPEDANQLLRLALVQPCPSGYLVAHGASDNAVKRLAIEATTATLGYRPKADAFGSGGSLR